MKNKLIQLLSLLFMCATLSSFAQEKQLTFTAYVSGCADNTELKLFEFDGVSFYEVQTAQQPKAYTYIFEMPMTETPRFYYFGQTAADIRPLILGTEKEVAFKASCDDFRGAKVSKSPLNKEYETLKSKMSNLRSRNNQLGRQYQIATRRGSDADKVQRIQAEMLTVDQQMAGLMDSLTKARPYFAHVIALNNYPSYINHSGEHANEIEYFINEYFQFADWSNKDYNYLPWVYESIKSYATTLSKINLPDEIHRQYLQQIIDKVPASSRTRKLAYGGILAALQPLTHGNYAYFAQQFISEYKDNDQRAATAVSAELKRVAAFTVGGTPPDFTQPSPEGKAISLTDFRGKVTLIDFWASWCGPCRKENPNVVRMYEKYKDRGFEILGVSLDKTKDRWIQAIEKDQLTWPQVSDLKGWSNEVARTYGVTSIPQTVLLDKDGKIIARNLRGPTLEAKLAQIFED
ncbi:MAG: redoxin domain-containing protein [Bacteroidota bacterium]